VRPLAGGAWSSAYAFTRAGSEWVIRFNRHGEDLAKDELAGRYASADLPVPAVVERGAAGDRWYAVTPRLRGRFPETLDPAGFTRALPALIRLIAAMRDADTSAFDGFGPWDAGGRGAYPSWREYLLDVDADEPGRRTHGWRRALARDREAKETFAACMRALRAAVAACPEERQLVHADLLNGNVFVEGGRVVGVIDWGVSLYGDSLYDAALLAFWSPWYPAIDEAAVLAAARDLAGGSPSITARMRAYQLHIGLDHIAYNAFLGAERRDELARVCRRTAEIARRG
jgi:hygromycin-B 4-O-kinase